MIAARARSQCSGIWELVLPDCRIRGWTVRRIITGLFANPATDTVTVNKVHVLRDGKVIDVLAGGPCRGLAAPRGRGNAFAEYGLKF